MCVTVISSLYGHLQLALIRELAEQLLVEAGRKGTDQQAAVRQIVTRGKDSLDKLKNMAERLQPAMESARKSAARELTPAMIGG